MPITIIDRKILCQYYNGDDFTINPTTDYTVNFTGSVMQKVRVVHTIKLNNVVRSSDQNTLTTVNDTITRSIGSWIDDGFAVGDPIEAIATATGASANGLTVISVTHKVITYTGTLINSGAATPWTVPNANVNTAQLTVINGQAFRSMHTSFGLIENNETTNYVSKVDLNTQTYYVDNIGAGAAGSRTTGLDVNCFPLGNFKSWQTGQMTVNLVSEVGGYNQEQTFEVSHDFIIVPYGLESDRALIKAGLQPDIFDGLNSLKYVARYEFRSLLSNPNSSVVNIDDQLLGSVAGFGENYNGFNNVFTLNSVSYEQTSTGNSADGIIIGETTRVTAIISRSSGTWDGTQKVGVYISHLPNESEYQDQTNTLTDIWMYDSHRAVVGSGGTLANPYIIGYNFVHQASTQMLIQFDVLYNGSLLDLGDEFILGFEVATQGMSNPTTDLVMLHKIDEYQASADIPDLVDLKYIQIYPHGKDLGTGGFTDYKGCIEDGILLDFSFTLDHSKSSFINNFDVLLVAWNTLDDTFFEIEKVPYPLAAQIMVNQNGYLVQFFQLLYNRDFRLDDFDQFKDFNLVTGTTSLAGITFYTGQVGLKINWQEYLSLPNVDTVFTDVGEPNQGLNENTSRYSLKNGYEIRAVLSLNVGNGVINTDYYLTTPALQIFDYDDDGNSPNQWVTDIKTFDGLTNLGGAVLKNKTTKIEITYTNLTNPPTSTSGWVAITRIQENKNGSKGKIYELSSKRDDFNGNLLEPLVGQPRLDLTHSGSSLIATCNTDFLLLNNDACYDISGRIMCDVGTLQLTLTTQEGSFLAQNINIGSISDVQGLPMTGQAITIKFKKDDGTILENLTGVIGNNINTFTSDFLNTPTSITGFINGIVDTAGVLTFDKKAWALSQTTWYDHDDPQRMNLDFSTSVSNNNIDLLILKDFVGRAVRFTRDDTTTTMEFAEDSIYDSSFAASTTTPVTAGGSFKDITLPSTTDITVDPSVTQTLVSPATGDRKTKVELFCTWNDGLRNGLKTKTEIWSNMLGSGGTDVQEQYDGYILIDNSLPNLENDNLFTLQWYVRGRDHTPTPNTPIAIDVASVYQTDDTITNITTEAIVQNTSFQALQKTNFTQVSIIPDTELLDMSGVSYGEVVRFHIVLNDDWSGNDPGLSIYNDVTLKGY